VEAFSVAALVLELLEDLGQGVWHVLGGLGPFDPIYKRGVSTQRATETDVHALD
jgi:hypothetical protein